MSDEQDQIAELTHLYRRLQERFAENEIRFEALRALLVDREVIAQTDFAANVQTLTAAWQAQEKSQWPLESLLGRLAKPPRSTQ